MVEQFVGYYVVLQAVLSGMHGGMFYIFSNTIMPVLQKVEKPIGATVMKSVNRVILNKSFFLIFVGGALLSIALLIAVFVLETQVNRFWIAMGFIGQFVGSFLVTGTRNVPLNEKLELLEEGSAFGKEFFELYLKKWTYWNTVRTYGSIWGAVSYCLALV